MKVMLVAMSFFPDRGGGEMYLGGLVKNFLAQGIDVLVVAPGQRDEVYTHEGIWVQRICPGPIGTKDLRKLYESEDERFANKFKLVLKTFFPDIVHLHVRTHAISASLLRQIKAQGTPIIFTYHTAQATCPRGDLLRWGREICDGVLDLSQCVPCVLQQKGVPPSLVRWIGWTPVPLGRALEFFGFSGGIWTALRMRALMVLCHRAIREFLESCDRIVVLSNWSRDVLLRNEVPRKKIILSRVGVSRKLSVERREACTMRHQPESGPIRGICVGRFHPGKGWHLLVLAIRSDPGLRVEMDFYGVSSDPVGESYLAWLKKLAGEDPRIRFLGGIEDNRAVEYMATYDFLVVPSQWLETGPFVVPEAFAAGIPVIGSDLGGIAEQIRHETDGLLVQRSEVGAWHSVLKRITSEPKLLEKLRAGVLPPRTMRNVSAEMVTLYQSIGRRK